MVNILVVANSGTTDLLLDAVIKKLDGTEYNYDVVSVPSYNEIPAALSMAVSSSNYEGYVLLNYEVIEHEQDRRFAKQEVARLVNDLTVQFSLAIGSCFIFTGVESDDSSIEEQACKAVTTALHMVELKQHFMSIFDSVEDEDVVDYAF